MAKKGWVVPALEKYGNCALPDELLSTLGVRTTERLLSVIMEEEISVYKSGSVWIAKR